jgi:hypothetical protein
MAITIKKTAFIRFRSVDRARPGDLTRADPEASWAVGSTCRRAVAERYAPRGGQPASNDPTADSIEPPVAGGKPAGDTPTDPAPAPSDDLGDAGSDKIARLDQRRARHGNDD